MAKPKIDLKSRLGRRTAGGAAPSTASIPPPAPVGGGAVPAPQMPMAEAQAPQPAPAQAPAPVAGADPFGAVSAAPQQPMAGALGTSVVQAPAGGGPGGAAAAAFDIDDDFAAAQRGGRSKKVIAVTFFAALIGGVIGYAVGGLSEKDKVAQLAVGGAKDLIKEIGDANATAGKLSELLDATAETIKSGKFPEDQVSELGGINIPFDGSNLAGKAIGRFQPNLVTMLVNYTEMAARANEQKEKLQRVLSINKKGFEQLLAEKSNPQVRWGVYVQQGPQGPWGNMQILPNAFPVKGSKSSPAPWPSKFSVQEGKKTYELDRYMGGDLLRRGTKMIPIAPQTQGAVCPTDTVVRLRRELDGMKKILAGDDSIPGRETQGLVDLGDVIKKQLSKIGG